MTRKSIVLLGGPDSGKTNYIARLWPSFKMGKGLLRAERLPDNIAYVDAAVEHLMQGKFAPRSDRGIELGRADFTVSVRGANGTGPVTELMIPDITGELWTRAVASSEISQDWLDVLNEAEGAVVFVRALSDQNVKPLDWVAARNILGLVNDIDIEQEDIDRMAQSNEDRQSLRVEGIDEAGKSEAMHDLPTQVLLCELLRYLDICLANRAGGGSPQVAVVVAAYDLLDRSALVDGPMSYLRREFPLFAGRLVDTGRLNVKVFGLSVVGGDLAVDAEFRERFLGCDIAEQGWVVVQDGKGFSVDEDVMLPIAWAVGD